MAGPYSSDDVRPRSGERISEEGEPITWRLGREWAPFVGSTFSPQKRTNIQLWKLWTQDLRLDMTRGRKLKVGSKSHCAVPQIPRVIRCWLCDLPLASNFALAFNLAVGLAARFRRCFLGKGERAVFQQKHSIEGLWVVLIRSKEFLALASLLLSSNLAVFTAPQLFCRCHWRRNFLLLTSWFCLPINPICPSQPLRNDIGRDRKSGYPLVIRFLPLKSLHMHRRPGPSTHAKTTFLAQSAKS